jgi:cobalt/nickel transport protein
MTFKRKLLQALAATTFTGLAGAAHAHFQMLYVEETALQRAENLEFALVFTHPFSGGPTMAMGAPRAFSHSSSHGEEKIDLSKYLRPVEWQSRDNRTTAYRASIPRELVRSLGDHIFVLEPEPYLETEEDVYIQQFTKLIVNVGGVPGNWSEPQGLPVEIQPLNKPYANWTGGVFRAVVLADGKPVPFAEIEIEYVNHSIDLEKNAFGQQDYVTAPQASFKALSTYADAQGIVTIGLPRAGWWGIAALDIGATKTHKGKPLSQDAVLWVQARDMR